MIRWLFSWKTFLFLLVLAATVGALYLLSAFYTPRDEKAVRVALEARRKERVALDGEIAKLTETLKQEDASSPGSDAPRVNVAVEVLKEAPIQDMLVLPAVAEASEDILLPARNDGTLEWLGAKKGESVRKGQEIAKIDARILLEAHKSAEASQSLAEASFKRVSQLAAKNVASQGELDQARSQLDQARAALAIAKRNLEDATLLSSIDGRVDDIVPDVGEFVKRGDLVARLVNTSTIKMDLNVPEKDIGYFKVGQKARVRNPEPYEGETTGTIKRVRYVADNLTKTFLIEVWVDNPDDIFRPGMITKVSLIRRNRERALVVSAFAVLPTENGPIVYIEQDGVARARRIEIGIRRGMEFEVSKGLNPGDRLIVSGQRNLSDGSLVRVIEK